MSKLYLQFLFILIFPTPQDYFQLRANNLCAAERIQYISTEHPKVTYVNPKYLRYVNLTTTRYGRRNPLYYVNLHLRTLTTWHKNVSLHFYFYEFLTNVYKPSFIEMHFEVCHMIQHDKFFGAPLRQGKVAKPCPYPPDEYHLYNMSISLDVIPRGFPFRKGRIYCNGTSMDTKDLLGSAYIDMELKEIRTKEVKNG